MHTPDDLTPGERELENALKALNPSAAGVDSTELSYRLGMAAGRRAVRRWQGITGGTALLGLAATVASLSMHPAGPIAPGPRDEARAVPPAVEAQGAVVAAPPTSGGMEGWLAVSSYARQRDRTLRLGPDVLAVEPAPARERGDRSDAAPEPREQSDLDLFLLALTSGRRL